MSDTDINRPGVGNPLEGDRLLTPREVAGIFHVHVKTLVRWTKPTADGSAPRLKPVRTPGGHRRYRESEIRALLRGGSDG